MVPPKSKPRRVLVAVTLATLAIFGGLVAIITWQLRTRLRTEVLRREAEAIHAVALMQLGPAGDRLAQFDAELAIDDMFAAVLESSRLRGVFAVQLFDAKGTLREAKPIAPDDAESSRWWGDELKQPRVRFLPAGSVDMVSPQFAIQSGLTERLPLLDIVVPLHPDPTSPVAMGVARYWVDGSAVAAEFGRMDRGLAGQAGIAFAGGAVLVTLVLIWAFSRLAVANRRLLDQSADLARANEELDFAAKTGALGAISAHLIHGLKNPLAGIEGFVFETVIGSPEAIRGDACRTAIETTRRLRALVAEVTTVLKDETDGSADYPVPITEVVEAARVRTVVAAERAGIELSVFATPDVFVSARVSNLSGLVLANLVANAIEASPQGAIISIAARSVTEGIEFLIRDNGPGIPLKLQSELFRPVRSAKRGGGGVGLAISLRLAKHAGGNLELVRSNEQGTEFRLYVPALVTT